jgi:hypothetical protein
MVVEIRRYQDGDGQYVARHMRHADQREIWLFSCLTPAHAVPMTIANSLATWTATVDGTPAMIFGVCLKNPMSDVGVPWLLGTCEVDEHQYSFRQSRLYVRRMLDAFDVMENYALAENTKTLRWLKWLGFDMDEPRPAGPFGAAFVRFGKGLGCA